VLICSGSGSTFRWPRSRLSLGHQGSLHTAVNHPVVNAAAQQIDAPNSSTMPTCLLQVGMVDEWQNVETIV